LQLKIFTQEKITQTSGANSEHKHSKMSCSTLNECIITFWLQHHHSCLFSFRIQSMPLLVFLLKRLRHC